MGFEIGSVPEGNAHGRRCKLVSMAGEEGRRIFEEGNVEELNDNGHRTSGGRDESCEGGNVRDVHIYLQRSILSDCR